MGTQLTINELITGIRKGNFILPEFQRGYVWNQDQVKGYLDSLYRGYPTGSFLIWKTPNPGLTRGAQADIPAGADLILDGQQRLTSVYTLVTGEPPPFYEGERLYFNLYFNVQTEVFSYYKPTQMKGKPEWLPVTPFLKVGLGEYLGPSGPVSEEERQFLFQFFSRLARLDQVKQYTYYLDVLTEHDLDAVVKIFNLVNSKGTPLTKADLALSHICSRWPEARREMRRAQQEHKDAGFAFDLNFYVRCTAAVATESGTFEPIYDVAVERVKDAWRRAKRALDYLLTVLRAHAYIDSSASLTSHYVLVPLVVYLANGNGHFVSERERREFLHWMYAALMWSRYAATTETRLNQDIQALKDPNPTARLRAAIIAERGRIRVEGQDLANASTRTAFSTMAYVAARAAGAVDWVTGAPLYNKAVGKSNGLQYHHIFPQDLLYAPKGPYNPNVPGDRYRVNEIANIAFLTQAGNAEISNRPPSEYLPKVRERYPGALERQAVPLNPALWTLENYEAFLQARRAALADAINQFMDSLLADVPERRFTVADYIAAGEGETVEFKMSLRWDYRQETVNKALEKTVAKTLAAFMNSKGGTLVIGVSDDGQVVGLGADLQTLGRKDLDGWEQHLRNVLNSYLSKEICALVEVTFADVDGKPVAVVRAEPQPKPVYLTDTGGTAEFYVRSGNTTQQLNVKESLAYITQHFSLVG